MEAGFAVWITGLPSSGKSTVAAALREELDSLGANVAVLESDALRKVFTPSPRYDEAEREAFYGSLSHVGKILTDHGVSVIFDATAHRRAYRDRARREIARFLEVFVDCPLSVCIDRDPKGIYRRARKGEITEVPGLSVEYEPPRAPDVVVRGDADEPGDAARLIVRKLREKGFATG